MKLYGAEVMWALKIAALIGIRFEASTMQLFHYFILAVTVEGMVLQFLLQSISSSRMELFRWMEQYFASIMTYFGKQRTL